MILIEEIICWATGGGNDGEYIDAWEFTRKWLIRRWNIIEHLNLLTL